ncbi:MAG: hypothetical protein VKP72_12220 [bacterium]|nr:hypothetical protein [bacterium]
MSDNMITRVQQAPIIERSFAPVLTEIQTPKRDPAPTIDRAVMADQPELQAGIGLPPDLKRELNQIGTGGVGNIDILPPGFSLIGGVLDPQQLAGGNREPGIAGGGIGGVLDPARPAGGDNRPGTVDDVTRNQGEVTSNGEQFAGMGPMLGDPEVIELLKKMGKLMAGEAIDPADFLKKLGSSRDTLKAALEAKLGRPVNDHNLKVAEANLKSGGNLESAAKAVQSDPLVFDLNHDGDTNATVDQHGINVDGSTSTKWAEKGDGVLAFGDKPLDTNGGQYKDAMEMLTAKAQEAGIDTSKGFLDQADLKVLESKGLTMMVSNGDGTNQSVPPTQLGISQISLKGKAVDKTDVAGNTISLESSFVQNGQTHAMNDMWLNNIPVKQP